MSDEFFEEPLDSGPLEQANKNYDYFMKMFTMKIALEELLEWKAVLEDVIKDPDINEEEIKKTKLELKSIENIWTAFADELYEEHGVSA